jgi:glutathione S-transferase
VQALMWCIAELGIPVNRIDAGFTYGQTDTAEYLALNPNGTVPTLQDSDGTVLWESGAILRFIANKYSNNDFWPKAAVARAKVDMWAEWSKINIASAFTSPIFWQVARTPISRQDPRSIDIALRKFEHSLSVANTQLDNQIYLTGDTFTLADIQFGHVLYRYYDIAVTRKRLPCVRRYYDMLSKRTTYQDHVMISYAELVDTK